MTALKTCSNLAMLASVLLMFTYARAQQFGDAEMVYEWNMLEFDWPSEAEKQESIVNSSYVPERSLLAGIKLYKGQIYFTIPRWRWTSGHPVVLAKVVRVNSRTLLRPYPNWAAQKQGDCNALQYVQSMEIDPNTGLMYVIDTGRIGHILNLCPPKIVIYDLNSDKLVDKYEFPEDVVNRTACFLNDIVLDYVDGRVAYLYITNTFESTIVVYDVQTRSSYKIAHPTMGLEGNNAENITINGISYTFPMPVNGIAITPDFKYVYYSSLAGYNLNQVPTSTLRNRNAGTTGIRVAGRKASQTDGLAHGEQRLYYGAIGLNAVYYWDKENDLSDQNVSEDRVQMTTQVDLKRDNRTMEWPDTFAFDEQGWLWVITSRLQVYWMLPGLPEGGDPFLRVWKIYVNENSYLNRAVENTQKPGGTTDRGNSGHIIFPLIIGRSTSMFIVFFVSFGAFKVSRAILMM